MPTVITRTIGNGTRDYQSITAWIAGAASTYPGGLVAADVIWRGVLYPEGPGPNGEWNTATPYNYNGIVTSRDCHYLLEAAPGQSFWGHTAGLGRYNPSRGVSISTTGNYNHPFSDGGSANVNVVVVGLQVLATTAFIGIFFGSGSRVLFDRCLLQSGRATDRVSSGAHFQNCLIVLTGGAWLHNSTETPVISSTIIGTGTSPRVLNMGAYTTNNVIRNCAIFGFVDIANEYTPDVNLARSRYIATDIASLPWSNAHITGLNAADVFVSVTPGSEDYRLKAGSPLIGAGIRDELFTRDVSILNTARSPFNPSIGAWEAPYTAPTLPPFTGTGTFLSRKWRTQPQGSVEVDGASPLALRLRHALACTGAGYEELVTRGRLLYGTGVRYVSTPSGIGVRGDAFGDTSVRLSDHFIAGGSRGFSGSLFFLGYTHNRNFDGTIEGGDYLICEGTSIRKEGFSSGERMSWNSVTTSFESSGFNSLGFVPNNSRITAGLSATTLANGGLRAYSRGRLVGTAVGGTTALRFVGNASHTLRINDSVGIQGIGTTIPLALVWDRVVSAEEFQALHENPWQIVKPIKRMLYSFPPTFTWSYSRPRIDVAGGSGWSVYT